MIEALAGEPYVLVTTFRKNGTPVPTAVWAVADGDALAIWTVATSGKVKRIRNNPEVTVAPCDLRGRPRGEAVNARAEVLSAQDTERVRDLLRKKYGLQARLTLLGSRLRRGEAGTVAISITPSS
jgi:PPOX class probable F420-dependent enzyme, Rv2061 family